MRKVKIFLMFFSLMALISGCSYHENEEFKENDKAEISFDFDEGNQYGNVLVGKDGTLYFWKYNKNSFSNDGLWGAYEKLDTNNQFVSMNEKGEETILFEDHGYGEVVYYNDQIIYQKYDGSINVYSLEDQSLKTITRGSIEDLIGDTLIYSDEDNIYAYDLVHEESKKLGKGVYLMHEDEHIYYQNYDIENKKDITVIVLDLKDNHKNVVFTKSYNDIYTTENEIVLNYVEGNAVYFSYSYRAGSAATLQGGHIVKVNKDDYSIDSLNDETAIFSLGEGNEISYKDGVIGEGFNRIIYKDFSGNYYLGLKDGIYMFEHNGKETKLSDTSEYGDDRSFTRIEFIEKKGNDIYCLIHNSDRNSNNDIGWRLGATRKNSVFMKKNLHTNEITKIYEID